MEDKNILRKLVDLPIKTAAGLLVLAAKSGIPTKHYMEKVLIDHEMRKRSSAPHKSKNKNSVK